MINEKLPPSFLQGGHPTLRQLAARPAQPVNWSGRLLPIAPPLGNDQGPRPAHFQLVLRLHTLMVVIRQGWAWNHAVEAVLGLEKLSEGARKIPFADRDEFRVRLDVRLGVVARQVVGDCCSLFSKYHPGACIAHSALLTATITLFIDCGHGLGQRMV